MAKVFYPFRTICNFRGPLKRENQLAHGIRPQSAEAGATRGRGEFPEVRALRVADLEEPEP